MNEESNLRIVQQCYEKFGSGDILGLLSNLSGDIKWLTPAVENSPMAGQRSGLAQVSEFFDLLGKTLDISRFEQLEFVAQDEKVVVLGEFAATVKPTGRSYESEWVHVFHLRDGKITSFQEFFDNAAATRAFQKSVTA
ncbi:MAG: nuclear transport factor 2 family protein [Pyrinomonadaceae bacterium]